MNQTFQRTLSGIISTFIVCSIGSVSVLADIKKGQKTYMKTCKNCHGDGPRGAAMNTQEGWDELFANNAELIIKKHAGTKGEMFFNGDVFKQSSQDLRDFLHEYGSDSGNVLTCG